MVRKEQIFPIILMALMCLAAVVNAASGDYKKAVYWACVAFANMMVTF